MRDTTNVGRDKEIMLHIKRMRSSGKDGPFTGMDSKLFKKYIRLAKEGRPKLTEGA